MTQNSPCERRCARLAARLLILLLACSAAAQAQSLSGLIQVPELREISGLSASYRVPGRLWVHNDSGNPPRLYALDEQGRLQQVVEVRAGNRDWEDLAAFQWQGQPWLAIADTGANFSLRRQARILLLQEPVAVPQASSIGVSRYIDFDYPGATPDVEALAVDAPAGQILLLEKRRPPAQLYALDLAGPARQRARWLGELPDWWPEPATLVEPVGHQRYRGAATAMDLSRDGRHLAVLTSTHWMVFTREPGEDWAQVLRRQPCIGRIRAPDAPHWPAFFEALAWDAQGQLWLSGEQRDAPLLHLDPAPLCRAAGSY